MHTVHTLGHSFDAWPDEHTFLLEDARRRTSDEVDLGATWRAAGSNETWHLAWLRATGELYVCRNDSLVGNASAVGVLAVLPDEPTVDAVLDGWRAARDDEDGLGWLDDRMQQLVRAA